MEDIAKKIKQLTLSLEYKEDGTGCYALVLQWIKGIHGTVGRWSQELEMQYANRNIFRIINTEILLEIFEKNKTLVNQKYVSNRLLNWKAPF